MEEKSLICINCPLGCRLTATLEKGEVRAVTGNTCPRGEVYARRELSAPTRILTSTVRVTGGTLPVVSVKTADGIPKGRIFDCVEAIRDIELKAPVVMGQVVLADVCGTGVDIVATKNIPVKG